jgi:glycosyltransferase involved in cell wall biosynthesis
MVSEEQKGIDRYRCAKKQGGKMIPDKLSVIIPFAQEHPQVAFTVQAIYCELRDRCNFEIIVVDNHCEELEAQLLAAGQHRDNGGQYMSSLASSERQWLKYVKYDHKLSHWNAKNAGIAASDGEYLWFCDSHCIPSPGSLIGMFDYYRWRKPRNFGTVHLPLSYMLEQPGRELIYKLVSDQAHGIAHYTFTRYRDEKVVYNTPCMSTCGMMISRELLQSMGNWPTELGIYGGGEHFINFTLAVMGKTINIYPSKPLYHYAAPRGYYWNYADYHRNRCIATYIFAGEEWARRYVMNIKGEIEQKNAIFSTVIGSKAVINHRKLIASQQVKTIDEWLAEQGA